MKYLIVFLAVLVAVLATTLVSGDEGTSGAAMQVKTRGLLDGLLGRRKRGIVDGVIGGTAGAVVGAASGLLGQRKTDNNLVMTRCHMLGSTCHNYGNIQQSQKSPSNGNPTSMSQMKFPQGPSKKRSKRGIIDGVVNGAVGGVTGAAAGLLG